MNAIATALLFTLSPLLAAAPGGDACQVASSAVPMPGLPELVMGSQEHPVPDGARLTQAQIRSLARQDTQIRGALDQIEARFKKLPAGQGRAVQSDPAGKGLPELVAHLLASASREQAFLTDFATASEFQLADDDKSRACSLCLAVRRGLDAKFQWRSGELAKLTQDQEKEAAELAALREGLRRKWAEAVQKELDPAQLTWLRGAQMRWLQQTLRTSVASGLRSLGEQKCTEASAPKCVFGSILTRAVADAKQ